MVHIGILTCQDSPCQRNFFSVRKMPLWMRWLLNGLQEDCIAGSQGPSLRSCSFRGTCIACSLSGGNKLKDMRFF